MSVSSAMRIGVSGLNSFSTAIGIVSDNVANANSSAFKGSEARFGDLVSSYYSTQSRDTDREGAGSAVTGISTSFSQGPLQNTGKWSDLSINGDGFFKVNTGMDATDKSTTGVDFYTRDGSFHMDKNGFLVTSQGYYVLDNNNLAIQVEPGYTAATPSAQYQNYYVDADGYVWGTPVGGGNPEQLGNGDPINIASFPNQDGLIRQGANLYYIGPEAGVPIEGVNNTARGDVLDFSIEGSNVDIAAEMVNMIIYQADYNANSKTISTASEMINTVIGIVR